MSFAKILKDKKIITALVAIVAGGGFLINHQINKIKEEDTIKTLIQSVEFGSSVEKTVKTLIQSAEFRGAIVETVQIVLNQEGGVSSKIADMQNGINSQILEIKSLLDRGKEKMQTLETADSSDYKELNDKITKNREAGVERYIANLKEVHANSEKMHEIERRSLERDLKACQQLRLKR